METHLWVYQDIPKDIPNSLVAQQFTPERIADIMQTGTLSIFKHNNKLHILIFEKYCYQGENIWHKQYIKSDVKDADMLVILLKPRRGQARGDVQVENILNKIRKSITNSNVDSKLELNKQRIDYDDMDGTSHEIDMDMNIATLKLAKRKKQVDKVTYQLPEFVFRYQIIGRICEMEESK